VSRLGPLSFVAIAVILVALTATPESSGARYNTSIIVGYSIGGVALGTSQAALERFLGYKGQRSPTRTSDEKGAVDETYGYLRVTLIPCQAGRCVAAVATSSRAFQTARGVHVQSPIAKLVQAYPTSNCGQLPPSSDVSRPDGFCKVGFRSGDPGTTFLTVKNVISHRREVKTIAVASGATRWNIDPAARIYGPKRASSSTRATLVLTIIALLILLPGARLAWRFKQGHQLDPGGSDGRQLLTRKKKKRHRA
jgi:hypothetical protein